MSSMALQSPLEFAASYTADFVALSAAEAREILDVGCGDGLITRQLHRRGFKVVAIDASQKGIDRARKNGVEAIHMPLEQFEHSQFEAIYLSRSLHHMPPLAPTIEKLYQLLTANGTLIIEDFGFELANEASCEWLFKQSGKVLAERTEPVHCEFNHDWLHQEVRSSKDAFDFWQKRYLVDHKLWSSEQMLEALESRFSVRSILRVPYLFRFLCDLLPGATDGARSAREIFDAEQFLIESSKIAAVGWRVVLNK